jgi:hypothetical protein
MVRPPDLMVSTWFRPLADISARFVNQSLAPRFGEVMPAR